MAAKLKKRALAEYESQVQVEDTERSKRLRLVVGGRSDSQSREEEETLLTVGLDTQAREIVQHVVAFTADLERQSPEVLGQALRRVVELLGRVEDPCTKARLVQAWGDLLATGRLEEAAQRLEEVMASLREETSARVTAAWLAALSKVAAAVSLGRGTRQKLFRLGEQLLHATAHPLVHCKVLQLLSILTEAGESAESRELATQALGLCGAYSMAQDARVRTAAFHALLTIHKRGVKLDVSMYPVFCTALTDDYEGVRCEALKLISALAQTEPEFQVHDDTEPCSDCTTYPRWKWRETTLGKRSGWWMTSSPGPARRSTMSGRR